MRPTDPLSNHRATRRASARLLCAVLAILLAGCGGMTRAVGVLPNTTDDLAAKSEAFRRPAPPKNAIETPSTPAN